MGFCLTISFTLFVLFVVRALIKMETIGKPPIKLIDNSKCLLIGKEDMFGSEDIIHFHGSLFFASSDDYMYIMHNTSKGHVPGGIFIIDAALTASASTASKSYRKLKLVNYPFGDATFFPHGIYFSNDTKTIYAVNHPGGLDRIELFKVEGSTFEDTKLVYKRAITSPLFPAIGMNDVIESRKGEIYATNWLPFSSPVNGYDHPQNFKEKLIGSGTLPLLSFLKVLDIKGLGVTYVTRCTFSWDDDKDDKSVSCEHAADGLISANGITIDTKTKDRIFVLDCLGQSLHFFERNVDNGKLTLKNIQKIPHTGDNVEFDSESGEIRIGTIDRVDLTALRGVKYFKDKVFCSGGLLVGKPVPGKPYEFHYEDGIHHDGTVLTAISSAQEYRNIVLLGGPDGPGFLACKRD